MNPVRKFSENEWKKIQANVVPMPSEEILPKLGFKSQEEFDEKVQQGLIGIIEVQDQVRARVRGVPVHSSENKYNLVWQGESHITIPPDILKEMKNKGASILEIIPGKDEYLFYVKVR